MFGHGLGDEGVDGVGGGVSGHLIGHGKGPFSEARQLGAQWGRVKAAAA